MQQHSLSGNAPVNVYITGIDWTQQHRDNIEGTVEQVQKELAELFDEDAGNKKKRRDRRLLKEGSFR